MVERRGPTCQESSAWEWVSDYMRGRPASWAAVLRASWKRGPGYLLRMARVQGRVRTPISHTCPCRRPTLPEPLGRSPWENRAGRVHLPGKLRPGPTWSSPRAPSSWKVWLHLALMGPGSDRVSHGRERGDRRLRTGRD